LCSGRKAGAVIVRGVAADRNGLTEGPILRAFRRVADCSGSAGTRAMNGNRVIKSNVEIFNIRTWAGCTWRRNTYSAPTDKGPLLVLRERGEQRLGG